MDVFSTLFLLLIAPAAGSFMAVLADRLPRGEDVVMAPSRCRACKARLGLRDLVPLLSYPLLRGHCRHCGAPVPGWLWLMELAALGLAVLALLRGGTGWEIWCSALLLWLLLALAISDLRSFRLPDALTAALAALCLSVALVQGQLLWALAGGLIGAGSFMALRIAYAALRGREGLGLGDVKLMAGLGALTGPAQLPLLVLVAALMALAAALLRHRAPKGDLPLPFGTALCASAGLLWLLRETIL
ncbi:leader peptidase (prepilin peptidase) / N-methyltransferase [Mameliella alba]|uniref:prepilin peptidase n=1 Tax=Mameliella alba TaxID=561184 RepID=UPI00088517C3|nr:A24 family peptidase [Mameliella alba]OWV46769.1 prepilin peptidase [Mameliella alba]PTR37682.1 leader peptidase (prepilin peptidase)/N-methyltransferase [Mameliella alba]GGF50134.1 type 4 prepilin-like proteins leader peptide-processing enzyme [Mameliella alba]SDD64140.1 leader peptidase (prepilin peptidase) / N-methyltransferase [Mameliella alba]